MTAPTIFEFIDYRDYLNHYFEYKKRSFPSFSYRNFSLRAGISTNNYVQKILSKERSLGPKTTEQFVKGLALKKKEAEYFRKLVLLEKTDGIEQKADVLNILTKLKKSSANLNQYEDNDFYRNWANGIIYELASCKDFTTDSNSLYKILKKKVSINDIKDALSYLIRNNFLTIANGKAYQNRGAITSAQFSSNLYLRMNHFKMTEIAMSALALPLEERSFQGLLLAVDKKRMPEMKQKLKEMSEEILREFSSDENADTLYRFNFQVFPLTDFSEQLAPEKIIDIIH
jgi:uncharacterized protein (TIGR02147 family)